MKTLLKIFLIVGISSQLFSCNDCIECKDEKAVLASDQSIENADLAIDSLKITKTEGEDNFTFRANVSYNNDDCAVRPTLILMLPSNMVSNEIFSVKTSNDSIVRCTYPNRGCITCSLGDSICPKNLTKNFWVDVSMKSKVKNVSAFVYSQTADAVQCNNFKHLSAK